MSLFASQQTPVAPPGVYARVVVDRGIAQFGDDDRAGLGYRVPDGWSVGVGDRVEAPLGKAGKSVGGTVLELGGPELVDGATGIKSLTRVVGGGVLPRHIELARWMSTYYVCPLGMVLANMLPAAVKQRTGERSVVVVSWGVKARSGDEPAAASSLKGAAKRGWQAVCQLGPHELPLAAPALLDRTGIKSVATLSKLAAAGLLELRETLEVRAAAMPMQPTASPQPIPSLTSEQQSAVEGVSARLGAFGVHLLRGVTGSGKTEVYLRLIARALDANAGAIVLVPEIALTPQTSARFIGRFGASQVAVLHSGLTNAQRHAEWARVRRGSARVVVGARSALFAPLERPALIVVDEEHDSSYKQDQLPRYNARDVAIKMAQGIGASVVLGSATPSLESYVRATTHASGTSHLWELRERVGGATLPATRVVDMREERRQRAQLPDHHHGSQHLLGPTLERELDSTLRNGRQAMLLLNRRGFAHYLSCPRAACGFVVMCEDCDVPLVLHRDAGTPAGRVVKCHHCQLEQLVPALCGVCGRALTSIAGGTQRLADEVERKFAALGLRDGTTLLRVDSDTMRSAAEYFDTLGRFARGEARVLVGTQMIAKGLDFPGVTLVGIVDADTSLHIPDFRASERTFQLVSQAAGRAGRAGHAGRVIIQTYAPHLTAISHAAAHDFVSFAREELETRRRVGLPPFTRLARIVCRDEQAAKAMARAEEVAGALRRQADRMQGAVVVQGPAVCTLGRIARHHRVGIEVNAATAGVLRDVLTWVRREGLLKSDAATAVDVDPVSLL